MNKISRFYNIVNPAYYFFLYPFYRDDYIKCFHEINKHFPESKKHIRILDIGCGNGSFLPTVLDHRIDYYGMDLSDKAIKMAKDKHSDKNWSVNNFHKTNINEKYDVIIIAHTLSVDPEPIQLLTKALQQVKKRGLLIVVDHQKKSKPRKQLDCLLNKLNISLGFNWNQNIELNKDLMQTRCIKYEALNLWNKIAVFEKTE